MKAVKLFSSINHTNVWLATGNKIKTFFSSLRQKVFFVKLKCSRHFQVIIIVKMKEISNMFNYFTWVNVLIS